jgi:adenine-specific DNA-methyltransferase
MSQYVCDVCHVSFQQKSHYDAHKSRKRPCKKKGLGQFFTESEALQQFVWDKVEHRGSTLLEPSFGAGHLLQKFLEGNAEYPMVCYELDDTIAPIVSFGPSQMVVYGNFLLQPIAQKFRTIVGNPPYVKQGKTNLYVQFIERCFDVLTDDGELIFIVPSDFLKLTSTSSLLNRMTSVGCFTDFLFPHDERLFSSASVDVVVFRYRKGLISNQTMVNGVSKRYSNSNGIITFSDTEETGTRLEDMFHVYVGLVSGKDSVFKNPVGTREILCDKGKIERFILEDTFPSGKPAIDEHLTAHKAELLERKIRKFNETNWFEWGAPRNRVAMDKYRNRGCIYVRNMTRQKEVAWKGTVQYFGGSLLCMVPKEEGIDLDRVVRILNDPETKNNYMYSGRFKIGHKQLSNIQI